MNEDGDWWVAVEDASFKEARGQILNCLSYEIPEDGTLVYKGKEMSTLCQDLYHEVGPECDATCYRRTLAYHFVENRKW
jgi:hypothetical protein